MNSFIKCKNSNALQKLITIGKTLTLLVVMAIAIMLPNSVNTKVQASQDVGNVMVWTTNIDLFGMDARPYFTTVSQFYQDNNATVTTISKGHLTSNSLDGISLLWVFLPYENFTATDITYMSDFLATGGRIVFCGEHVGYFAQGNIYISNAVAALGGTFSVLAENATNPSGGVVSGSCIIKTSNLTNGLTGYFFSAAAKMSYSGSTQAVVTDNSGVPLVVDQAVGNGRITLFTDVNNWDSVTYANPAYYGNNAVLFLNLLTDARVNQEIVEEGGDPNSGFGGSPTYTITANAASFEPASALQYTFTVEYKSAEGTNGTFDNAQFDDNDVTVKNASGTSFIVHKDTSVGGGTGIVSGAGTNAVAVQYTVSAPDGTWDAADGGIYKIGTVNGAVKDSNNKMIGGNISAASFQVTVAEVAALTGVTLSGTAQVGEILTATVAPGGASVNYQWKADSVNVGANKATYTVQDSDLGKAITVTVTGTGIYTGEFSATAADVVIAGRTPITSVLIDEAEEVEVGQTLTAEVAPSEATVDYQWKVNGISVGTNTATYKVQTADLGKIITVTATGTGDYKGKVSSSATSEVTAAKTPITNVSISGLAVLGQTLTATVTPNNATVTYQWKADGIAIGTNSATYIVQTADLGKTITVTATGTESYKGALTSAATSEVIAAITVKINNGAEIGGVSLSGAIGSTPINTITSLVITGGIVTANDWNYLRYLYTLTDFIVQDTVTTVADMPTNGYVFPSTIKTVNIEKATSIGYVAFGNCTSLTSATFPAVTSMGNYAFYNCISLVSLKLPATPPTNMNNTAFLNCPTNRYLDFVDQNGAALTGEALISAQNAYKAVSDDSTNDNLWYSWRIMPPTPITSVSINGTAQVGEILTAEVAPEGATVTYQWKANGTNVGYNTSTYTVQAADYGKTFTVTATGTGDYSGAVTSVTTSPAIAAKTPINSVVISGIAEVGETITATVYPSGATVSYQWKADGSNVGPDTATYTVQAADLGKRISVTVTGTDNYKGVVTSGYTSYVIAAKTPVTAVSVTGSAIVGEILTATVAPEGATVSYQWKANGTNVGLNNSAYTVQAADFGKVITVTATGTGNYSGAATSAATSAVTAAKIPINSAVISGIAEVGETITATVNPSGATVSYQWKADTSNVGTNSSTYTVQAADLGKRISVTVTGTDNYKGAATSGSTSNVIAARTPVTAVSVTGSAIVGEILTAAVTPEGATVSYQWKANGTNVGLNNSAYTVQAADFGKVITVTATGTGNYSGAATSVATSVVTGGTTLPPVNTALTAVSVSGSAIVGEILSASVVPGGATVTYQWKADGMNVGLDTATYTVQAADLGKTITVTVIGIENYTGTVSSTPTSTVIAGSTPPTEPPTEPTDLEKAKTAAGTKNAADYTIDSWKVLTDALLLPETTDEEILAKTAAIYNAIAGLVNGSSPVDLYTITGLIKDGNNPLSGATVILVDTTDPTKTYSGITDENGYYIISGVPNGSYLITIIKNGTLFNGNILVNGSNVSGGSGDFTVISTSTPTPTPTPAPASTSEEITIDVKQGNTDNTVSNIVIKRVTDEKGNKSDKVTYEEEKAEETIKHLKEQGNDVARIVIPETKDEITQTTVDIPVATLDTIAKGEINIQIETEKAKIDLPKQALQNANDNLKDNLYFNLIPITNEEQKQEIEKRAVFQATIIKETNDDTETSVKIISEPVTIETNMPSSPVDITLPLTGIDIPADPAMREAFIKQLAVYIEHSDGDKELLQGEIVEYKTGVLGLRFHITKFSVFTIVKTDVFKKNAECELVKISQPAETVVNGTEISATVADKVSSITIKAEISDKAMLQVYSDEECTKEIAEGKLALKTGANKVYLKVTAEDGTVKIYTMTITRSKSAATDIAKLDLGQNTVINGNNIEVKAASGTAALTIKVTASGKATWKLYSNKACTKELSDRQMKLKDGVNTAYLKVIAEDGTTSKTYTIKVMREAAPVAQYNTHVKLGLIGSKTYAQEVAKIYEKDYDCDNVIVKKEGKYYRVYMDFTGMAAARAACKDMIARKYIMNYYFYTK